MHVQTSTQREHRETGRMDVEGDFEVTLHDLGRYLQKLRENRRVTQTSLSTKTGAMGGHKISRSRISEIENAKRDPVSERELRGYMVGLKCASPHIDRMVTALRQYTATPADPVPPRSAIPDPDPGGLGGADDDLTPRKERSPDDPPPAGPEEQGRERWPREDRPVPLLDASPPPPARHRGRRHRVAGAAAIAGVVVAVTWFGVEFFLHREGTHSPMVPGHPAALVAPHAAPIPPDTPVVVNTVPSADPARTRFPTTDPQTATIHDRPGPGDTASRDTTEHPPGPCCAHPGHDQALDMAVRPPSHWPSSDGSSSEGRSYAAETRDGWPLPSAFSSPWPR